MKDFIRQDVHSEFCKCELCRKPVLNVLEINGIAYQVNKRYVCSSKEHGAIESDVVDMRDSTPCKSILKWTKELPTKEGWYHYRFASGTFTMLNVLCYNNTFIINDPDEIIYVDCFDEGEWCGPIEAPEYP